VPLDLLERVRQILDEERNEAQLDKFLADVRESLASSNRQFLSYQALTIGALVTYYLVVYGKSTDVSVYGIAVHDASLFRRVFLVVPAALLAATSVVGYMRLLQRGVYDYLSISRYPIIGKTGLHELRLPSDFVLGFFVLRELGGFPGKIISYIVATLCLMAFVFGPITYVAMEAVKNIHIFGTSDLLCLTASIGAIVLVECALLVVLLAGLIRNA
jgi:hypothetical protein